MAPPTLDNTLSPLGEPPGIILPDGYSDGCDIYSTKRQRVSYDGKYSPCPSPNSSICHSPFSDPGETSASSTPYPAQFPPPSPLSPPSPQPIPVLDILKPKDNTDGKSILNSLMTDLSTVFNTRALQEVDQEACFGMVCRTSSILPATFGITQENFQAREMPKLALQLWIWLSRYHKIPRHLIHNGNPKPCLLAKIRYP